MPAPCASGSKTSRLCRAAYCAALVAAEMRALQRNGFDFLCHLTDIKAWVESSQRHGRGKTLQTLAWLAWLKHRNTKIPSLARYLSPRSMLLTGGERRTFSSNLKACLESGAAARPICATIPQPDINRHHYALLRRDLEELAKFSFAQRFLPRRNSSKPRPRR